MTTKTAVPVPVPPPPPLPPPSPPPSPPPPARSYKCKDKQASTILQNNTVSIHPSNVIYNLTASTDEIYRKKMKETREIYILFLFSLAPSSSGSPLLVMATFHLSHLVLLVPVVPPILSPSGSYISCFLL